MKKLTAGIFTVLLGVVSVGAANAEITSKAYVDGKFNPLSATVTDLQKTVTENETASGNNAVAIEDINKQLDTKADSADVTALTGRVKVNEDAIKMLNGTEETEGSVAQKITSALGGYAKSDDVTQEITTATQGLLSASDADKAYAPIATKNAVDTLTGGADVVGSIANTLQPYAKTADVTADIDAAKTAAATDAQSKADAAQSAAEATAKNYTDGQITTVNANLGKKADKVANVAAEKVGSIATVTSDGGYEMADTKITDLATSSQLNTAKSDAIATAAADATTKADTALASAKEYTDTEVGKVDAKLADYATTAAMTTELGKKLDTTKYNTEVGTVSAENMGSTTATTVVAGIKEANDAVKANDARITENTTKIEEQLGTLGDDVESRLPRPEHGCEDPRNKCVLVSAGKGNYTWELISRGDNETGGAE